MSGQFVDQQRNERNAGLLLIAAAALAVLAGNGPFAATYQDVLHFKFGPALPHMGQMALHHWIADGFEAIEAMIQPGPYCFGNEVTLADICLVPQVYNARRLKAPLDRFPKIIAVDAALAKLPAFDKARPENQPDAE